MKDLLSFEEAQARLLARAVLPTEREVVSLLGVPGALNGRILAADCVSALAVPPSDNSAMDGYALRAADCATVLPISQRIAAGALAEPLVLGTAARIFTGAPIPAGADAVLMQEHGTLVDGVLRVDRSVQIGENIRRRGEDIAEGQTVLQAGDKLTPAAIGLAASLGLAELSVWRRLRVAVFFTGDELTEPGQVLAPGKIFNSNRYVLGSLLTEMGCEVVDLGSVPDNLAATEAALSTAADQADVVITCGGVSVGEEDHVKTAVLAQGRLDTWRIAIKPGKPLAFGAIHRAGGEVPFIGLPGNPVSSWATFQLLVRPYLRRCQGLREVLPKWLSLQAGFDWPKLLPVREFLRVRCNAAGMLERFPNQGSGVLTACYWAEGLVSNPPQTAIRLGDIVQYLPLNALV